MYTYEIKELDGSVRGNTHQAVIYRNGKKVSVHGTRRGRQVAEKEALATIRHYEKQSARDKAGY